MEMGGIYKIVNKINQHAYYGRAVNFKKRWSRHKTDLNKNKHHCKYLQNAWNLYGSDNFEFVIIEEIKQGNMSRKDYIQLLKKHEQKYIDNHYYKDGYNCSNSSAGGKVAVEYHKWEDLLPYYDSILEEYKNTLNCEKIAKKYNVGCYTIIQLLQNKGGYNYICDKEVYQYNVDGTLYKKYNSIEDACIFNNINNRTLTNALNKKHFRKDTRCYLNGYIWSYTIINPTVIEQLTGQLQYGRNNPIIQYTKDGEIVNIYPSIHIEGFPSIKAIRDVCEGYKKSYKNYVWEFIKNISENEIAKIANERLKR